jgi:DNA-binding IclR family transcriptional regulator
VVATVKPSDVEGGHQLLVLGKLTGILDAFTAERPRLSRSEIREATELPATTCNRLLSNLLAEGLLDQDGGWYRIGPRVMRWSAAAASGLDLPTVLGPVLEHLRDATGESAAVFTRRGASRTCVAVAQTRHAVIWQLHVGMSTPLYVGSGGRAILAFDPGLAEEVLAGPRRTYTRNTITKAPDLRAALEKTREAGLAVSDQELDHDVAGVSAPIFAADGTVGASIGVAGPAQRFTEADVAGYLPAVREAARDAANLLGGSYEPAMAEAEP